jgi:peroxiredoxin
MSTLKTGDKAQTFSLPGIYDTQHALADYDDKEAVVVIFSCNHCPYVRAWENRMVKVQSDYGARGVQLIAINANDPSQYPDDSFPMMKERAKQQGFNFPYLYDETQEVARAYEAQRTPEVFVFDGQRTLRYHGPIDDNYDEPGAVKANYLRDALDAVLVGRAPSVTEVEPVGCTIKWRKG